MSGADLDSGHMEQLARVIAALAGMARTANHRYALVLSGSADWCMQSIRAVLPESGFEQVLWISSRAPDDAWSMSGRRARLVLGREADALVFDAWSGFDADAFGASCGTVRGGGLLFLLMPPLESLSGFIDPENSRITVAPYRPAELGNRFLTRLMRVVCADDDVTIFRQGVGPPAVPSCSIHRMTARFQDPACRTPDQRQAVDTIIKISAGHAHRRRPVVLTSDRGRGKSAALGIAAAHLLSKGLERLIVTGPGLDAVEPVFGHARRLLPEADSSRAVIHSGSGHMVFVPPDELIQTPQRADLVLVDEAAAIPAPLLEQLLQYYPRIVFATTIHGYEGTGRGFALRFHKVLDERTRGWRALRLHTPIRWTSGDPLERLVFRALLLNASPASDDAVTAASPDACIAERLDREALVDDEAMLAELFGLLVSAHYRTRPCDLRHLLDGPNLDVQVLRHAGHVVATALIATEGGFDEATSRLIREGRTRPHGHLIPESLASHVGLEEAPLLKCARIMRIAVHPAVQGRGFGTRLLSSVFERAGSDGMDYVGSSFGASVELLRFWERSGFYPVRVSVKRGASSGAHSVMVLRPLSSRGTTLFDTARERYRRLYPHQLTDPLRSLDPALAACLLRFGWESRSPGLDDRDWRDVLDFAYGRRLYDVCLAPLWELVYTALSDPGIGRLLSQPDIDVLILKVMQMRSWSQVSASLGLTGRKEVVEAIRCAVRPLVLHYGDESLHTEARLLEGIFGKDRD